MNVQLLLLYQCIWYLTSCNDDNGPSLSSLKMEFFSSSNLLVTAHFMRRKYSIFTVITSLSPLDLQTRNPIKSCWTQVLKNTGFLSTGWSGSTWAEMWGSVPKRFPASFPPFLKTPPEQVFIHPFLSPQLLALNPKAAAPEHSHHPKHVQEPAKPFP